MIIELIVFSGGIWLGHKIGHWRGRKAPLPKSLDTAARKLLGR